MLPYIEEREISLSTDTTKSNLKNAAVRELNKIEKFYPDVLERLSTESHEKAIIKCVYSWKSHKQHEKIIKAIKKHAGMFFKPLAKKN
jgi:rubrerythrin